MKKVLITGVSSGFGKFLVNKFSNINYKVIGVDRNKPEEIRDNLNSKLFAYFKVDLSDIDEVKQVFPEIFENHFPDIIINNAGMKFFKEFKSVNVSDIEDVIGVNFLAPLIITKIWLSYVSDSHLTNVLISSNAGYHGYNKGSLYCSSKGGLRLFAESIYGENTGKNVNTITLCPETFSTNPSIKSKYSMEYVFEKILKAINQNKSVEIPIISFKNKLRYLYVDLKKYSKWFSL